MSIYSNVDFIVLNFHQLTDSKVQLNETNVNNHKSNNITKSYQEDTGLTCRLWQIGFCKQVRSELFPEGQAIDVALCTSLGRSLQILGAPGICGRQAQLY